MTEDSLKHQGINDIGFWAFALAFPPLGMLFPQVALSPLPHFFQATFLDALRPHVMSQCQAASTRSIPTPALSCSSFPHVMLCLRLFAPLHMKLGTQCGSLLSLQHLEQCRPVAGAQGSVNEQMQAMKAMRGSGSSWLNEYQMMRPTEVDRGWGLGDVKLPRVLPGVCPAPV